MDFLDAKDYEQVRADKFFDFVQRLLKNKGDFSHRGALE